MRHLPRHPHFWLAGLLFWLGALWWLSSSKLPGEYVPPVDNFDKVAHFGYFFGGSGLLCAWLFRRRPEHPNWSAIISTAVLVVALIGGLDEYHQSFTPGRSGNNLPDWIADVLGATVGAFTFKRVHHLLK